MLSKYVQGRGGCLNCIIIVYYSRDFLKRNKRRLFSTFTSVHPMGYYIVRGITRVSCPASFRLMFHFCETMIKVTFILEASRHMSARYNSLIIIIDR